VDKLKPFSKLRNKLIFSFVILSLLLFICMSAFNDASGDKRLIFTFIFIGLATIAIYLLTSPIEKFTAAVEMAVKKRDFTQHVAVGTQDEIGQLSQSFQEIVNWMKETERIVSGLAEGNLDQKVEIKSDTDAFGMAFQSMIVSLKNSQEALRESKRNLAVWLPMPLSD